MSGVLLEYVVVAAQMGVSFIEEHELWNQVRLWTVS